MLTFNKNLVMKKISSIVALSVLILLGSCEKFLDEQPLVDPALSQFYKNKYDIDAAMAGMYNAFQSQMVRSGESGNSGNVTENALYWGEYRSDNFDRDIVYPKEDFNQIIENSILPSNDFADWTGLYSVIGRANMLIKYIPQAASLDGQLTEGIQKSYLAQCYGIRAISYFYIIRVWKNAPIWTEPFEDLKQDPERTQESQQKIIDEVIIPDLENAYSLIVKGERPVVYNISEGAICAIMADVYMWKKDYPNAIKWIQNLFKAKSPTNTTYLGVDGSNLQATASWKSIFTSPATSKEAIWSLHWDWEKNGCACMQTSWSPNNKNIVIDEDIFASWFAVQTSTTPSPDIRPKQTADVYPVANNKRNRFLKWYPTAANPTAADPWPLTNEQVPVYFTMYRLADIYLLYAEALNGSNDLPNALKYLNFVRVRAGLPAYENTDPLVSGKEAMEDAILNERQKELFGEGKRWFDLMRTGKVKEVMDPIMIRRQAGNIDQPGFVDPENRQYWPISRNVLNANKKLIQNSGYTD